jgi:general secretion pathway protein G
LTELIAVIAVIGILTGILIPVISRSIERVELATCSQNMRSCYTAINLYAIDHDGTYPPVSLSLDGSPPINWAYAVAPYMGAKTDDYWGMMTVIDSMNCPTHGKVIATRLNNDSMRDFRNIAMSFAFGPSTLLKEYRKTNHIQNPSQTMLLTEAGLPGNGSTSTQIDKVMLIDSGKDGNGNYTGGVHNGANNVMWADGHLSLFYDVQQLTTGDYNYWQPLDAWAGGGRTPQ